MAIQTRGEYEEVQIDYPIIRHARRYPLFCPCIRSRGDGHEISKAYKKAFNEQSAEVIAELYADDAA